MDERFTYLPMNEAGTAIHNELRDKLSSITRLLESVPGNREMSLALTKLEEAAMWAAKGLSRTAVYKGVKP